MRTMQLIFTFFGLLVRMARPGGARTVMAGNVAFRQQLMTLNAGRRRAPKLSLFDRLVYGLLAAFIPAKRLSKVAIILKPATILKFHQALVKAKYRWLYSAKAPRKPGPKGPSQAIIDAVLEMKRRNPRFGYRRIAMQINLAFGVDIDKDVVGRILKKYDKGHPKGSGPSWLTFIGHMKDSLWSIDFFRCESIHLKTHWVMLVMDQFTRRLIGFAVHAGHLDGITICRLFNQMIHQQRLPKYLSSDNDPLFKYHRWQANLRILEIKAIKSVPHVPISHPFVERLIGTVRREFLNHVLFWTGADLDKKLANFLGYYNSQRGHSSLKGRTPANESDGSSEGAVIPLDNYRWQSHCRGLFDLPKAA